MGELIKSKLVEDAPEICNDAEGVVVPIPTLPELEINNKFVDPEVIVNDPVPVETEAVTDPVDIYDPPPPPEPPFKA